MDLTTIAVVMVSMLPVFGEDRGSPTKGEQLGRVARVTALAVERSKGWQGDPVEHLAFLLALGSHETNFSERVGRGECGPRECDAYYERGGKRVSFLSWQTRGGDVVHRAAGWWQLHDRAASSRERWRLAFADEEVSAREAARVIVRMRGTCRSEEKKGGDWVRMTFAALAARGCKGSFRGIDQRVATYRRLLSARGKEGLAWR